MRLATDFQIALLAATAVWAVWYWGPIFLEVLLDPFKERFADVDELAARECDGFPTGSVRPDKGGRR